MAEMMEKGAMANMPDRAMMEKQMPDRQMPEREMQANNMPEEAKARLMQPSDEISAVLMSRLTNMSPEELRSLDSAITPEVARVLMKLLPELRRLIEQVAGQSQQMPREQMGALGGMR